MLISGTSATDGLSLVQLATPKPPAKADAGSGFPVIEIVLQDRTLAIVCHEGSLKGVLAERVGYCKRLATVRHRR